MKAARRNSGPNRRTPRSNTIRLNGGRDSSRVSTHALGRPRADSALTNVLSGRPKSVMPHTYI